MVVSVENGWRRLVDFFFSGYFYQASIRPFPTNSTPYVCRPPCFFFFARAPPPPPPHAVRCRPSARPEEAGDGDLGQAPGLLHPRPLLPEAGARGEELGRPPAAIGALPLSRFFVGVGGRFCLKWTTGKKSGYPDSDLKLLEDLDKLFCFFSPRSCGGGGGDLIAKPCGSAYNSRGGFLFHSFQPSFFPKTGSVFPGFLEVFWKEGSLERMGKVPLEFRLAPVGGG